MKHRGFLYAYGVASAHTTVILKGILRSFAIIFMGLTNAKIGRNFEMTKFLHIEILRASLPSYILHLPSYFFQVTSYIRHHPSDIIHLFRTSPVPFNLEGAPPLSCTLRLSLLHYGKRGPSKVRHELLIALRRRVQRASPSSKFKGQRSKVEGETQKNLIYFVFRGICTNFVGI